MDSEPVWPTILSQRLPPLLPTDVISAARLILLPLLVIASAGFDSRELVSSTKLLLALYTLYALLLWIRPLQTNPVVQSVQRRAAWIDLGWFTLLFAFSNTNHQTVFLFGFLFAMLSASLNSGYASGLRIGIASVIATATIGVVLELRDPEFELSRLAGALLFFVATGCVTSYFAGSALELKRQFLLLQEITSLSNPQFGADRTITSMMERLRAFYGAASCVLIMAEGEPSNYRLRRVDSHGPDPVLCGEVVSEELKQQLRGLASTKAVVYSRESPGWLQHVDRYYESEVVNGIAGDPAEGESSDRVATILEAESFLAVPLYHHRVVGRLYLASQKPHAFVQSDAKLVYQIIMRILPLIEIIRLADRLASEAAERERRKIACDIHDSVIQPYIGIQLGLTALRRKIQRGEVELDEEIGTLMEMTDGEIFGLRGYIAGLTATGVTEITLLESLRSFARKFSSASGIAVEVRNGTEIKISDRLALEAFQMVVEGLSNIRRHSRATRAIIQVGCDREYFALQIEDKSSGERKRLPFIPRSITTRAIALGGHVQVQQSDNGRTAIRVKIPL